VHRECSNHLLEIIEDPAVLAGSTDMLQKAEVIILIEFKNVSVHLSRIRCERVHVLFWTAHFRFSEYQFPSFGMIAKNIHIGPTALRRAERKPQLGSETSLLEIRFENRLNRHCFGH
jgi:hypothetical protein